MLEKTPAEVVNTEDEKTGTGKLINNHRIMSQRARVIQLYKTLSRLGKDHRLGHDAFRRQLQLVFNKHKHEKCPKKIEVLIAHGEYIVKELEALQKLKRYQLLKRQYLMGILKSKFNELLPHKKENVESNVKSNEEGKSNDGLDETSIRQSEKIIKNIRAQAKVLQGSLQKIAEADLHKDQQNVSQSSNEQQNVSQSSNQQQRVPQKNVSAESVTNSQGPQKNIEINVYLTGSAVTYDTPSEEKPKKESSAELLKEKQTSNSIKEPNISKEFTKQLEITRNIFNIFETYLKSISDKSQFEEAFTKSLASRENRLKKSETNNEEIGEVKQEQVDEKGKERSGKGNPVLPSKPNKS